MKPVIVSIVNHKGGVLKTTTAINLGCALARKGLRILLVDMDAQQNMTVGLIGRIPLRDDEPTLMEAIVDGDGLTHLIRKTQQERMNIIPCAEDLHRLTLSLAPQHGREFALRRCLQRTDISSYDFVIIDNAPSIELPVVNSLCASDFFLVPCAAEFFAMEGLELLASSIELVRVLAPDLCLAGIVITDWHQNERECRAAEQDLRGSDLGPYVFDTKVRVNTKAKSAPRAKQTIFEYEKGRPEREQRGTQDYAALGDEFLRRLDAARAPEPAVVHG